MEMPSGMHKKILLANQWDNANQVISGIRLWLRHRDQIRPIFHTINPVGMRKWRKLQLKGFPAGGLFLFCLLVRTRRHFR